MHGWENNIKMDLKEIVCEDVDWIYRIRIGTRGGLL
jgi:hypothetical protein